jgi:apolipoprotein N-acyltransferase
MRLSSAVVSFAIAFICLWISFLGSLVLAAHYHLGFWGWIPIWACGVVVAMWLSTFRARVGCIGGEGERLILTA